nr:MAG: DNA pilot protein [Microvirus Sku114]
MDLFGLGSLAGAVTDGVIGGLNYNEQKKYNEQQLALQREQFEYQKNLQQEIFNREDSATQRKVQDLIKSGLNPLLAGGQGANAGGAVGMIQMGGQQAPQLNIDAQGAIDSVYNAMKMKQDIATTKAQRALTATQIASEVAKAENIKESTREINQKILESQYNYRKYKGLNLPIGYIANNPYSATQGALFMANNANEAAAQAMKDADKIEKEANETWSKEQRKQSATRGKHTSQYVNDPNMPSYIFEQEAMRK